MVVAVVAGSASTALSGSGGVVERANWQRCEGESRPDQIKLHLLQKIGQPIFGPNAPRNRHDPQGRRHAMIGPGRAAGFSCLQRAHATSSCAANAYWRCVVVPPVSTEQSLSPESVASVNLHTELQIGTYATRCRCCTQTATLQHHPVSCHCIGADTPSAGFARSRLPYPRTSYRQYQWLVYPATCAVRRYDDHIATSAFQTEAFPINKAQIVTKAPLISSTTC